VTVLSSGLDGGEMRSPTDDLLNGSSIYFRIKLHLDQMGLYLLIGPGNFEPGEMLVFGKLKGLDFPYQLEG
jgi:hypothetical protein